MTREEAIIALDIVDHMESFAVLYEPGERMNPTTVGKLKEACRMAVSILRAQTDTPPNNPLTLEELREMDGEPVWCVDGRGNACWCLVNCDDGLPCCYDNETGLWENFFYAMSGDGQHGLHQSGWLAYRRKPEKAATGGRG